MFDSCIAFNTAKTCTYSGVSIIECMYDTVCDMWSVLEPLEPAFHLLASMSLYSGGL
jgi:hypothetical protein